MPEFKAKHIRGRKYGVKPDENGFFHIPIVSRVAGMDKSERDGLVVIIPQHDVWKFMAEVIREQKLAQLKSKLDGTSAYDLVIGSIK